MSDNVFQFPQKSFGLATGALPLSIGAQGSAVAELQEKLSIVGFQTPGGGVFDAQTADAVKAYQTANYRDPNLLQKLEARRYPGWVDPNPPEVFRKDGVVDQQTWESLQVAVQKRSALAPSSLVNKFPTSIIGSSPGGRPLWQWGLIALGVVGGIALLLKLAEEKGSVSGVRRLLSDEKDVGSGSTKKCGRTPGDDKLVDAETLEAV